MAIIKPFRAYRPQSDIVAEISCPPYDVISREEAHYLAQGHERNFLHVTRSDLEFPHEVDAYAPEIYDRAKVNWQKLVRENIFFQEAEENLYIYRLTANGRSQTGVVAGYSVAEYNSSAIRIHEKTRVEKENDRVRHISTVGIHAEPVFLSFAQTASIQQIIADEIQQAPLYDFQSADGVQHTLWRVAKKTELTEAFRAIKVLYIADGHHRAKSASRVHEELKRTQNISDQHAANYFLAVAFPDVEPNILPYNRVIKKYAGSAEQILKKLSAIIKEIPDARPAPGQKGHISVYLKHKWHSFELPKPDPLANVVQQLDVSILQDRVLQPVFAIIDPRTDHNIEFVGGIRGSKELTMLVDSHKAIVAFSMYPVTMQDLISIADNNELMPPKSTWFEPKLRSGLFVYSL
ncbi:MAG: DUF1015 domain-containing protein [Deltaproteobacteria bacterium]|nr:DUF1015 domain-containing protein [Deltaproteobacteria bacterium]